MLAGLKIEAEVYVPLMLHGLCAGFPSPADDYIEESIDLTKLLIRNPPATFLWKVDGNSMRDAGIFHGDLIVVDRSLSPVDGDIVVATVHGERSLKRLHTSATRRPAAFMSPWKVVIRVLLWSCRAGGRRSCRGSRGVSCRGPCGGR